MDGSSTTTARRSSSWQGRRPSRNGDNDNEYWKVTTTDGTQYFFGLHRLPAARRASRRPTRPGPCRSTATTPASRATTPATSPRSVRPRRGGGTWTTSSTRTATRWRTSTSKETGAYGRENDPGKRTTLRPRRLAGPDRVRQPRRRRGDDAAPRAGACSTRPSGACRLLTDAGWTRTRSPAAWPDTPWDQYCEAGAVHRPARRRSGRRSG